MKAKEFAKHLMKHPELEVLVARDEYEGDAVVHPIRGVKTKKKPNSEEEVLLVDTGNSYNIAKSNIDELAEILADTGMEPEEMPDDIVDVACEEAEKESDENPAVEGPAGVPELAGPKIESTQTGMEIQPQQAVAPDAAEPKYAIVERNPCAAELVQADYNESDVKTWIKNNPMDAENREDLCNWCCDHFDVPDDKVDRVWDLCDQLQGHLPK